jgi:hypothetical protein
LATPKSQTFTWSPSWIMMLDGLMGPKAKDPLNRESANPWDRPRRKRDPLLR